MTRDAPDTPYPDAAEFIARVTSLYGLDRIVDAGLAWTPELAIEYPRLKVTGLALPGQAAVERARYPFGGVVDLGIPGRAGELMPAGATAGALLVTGPCGMLCGPDGALAKLAGPVASASLLVLATDNSPPVLAEMAAVGLRPEFTGRTRARGGDAERSAHLLVFDRLLASTGRETGPETDHAPDDFRVVAIMTAYNEEDVIGPAIEKLVGDGVGVYVIDNWSTDRTNEIVRGFEGRGLVGIERFPDAPSDRFVLQALLRRVASVAAEIEADWLIHHDADERRYGPWPGLGLRDSLWRVDRAGFSAVDHTVVNFRPIDDGFVGGSDFEAYLRHFEFGRTSDLLLQIKAWKNAGQVDLATWAGHQVLFPDRRVFPYKFLLKHYPIRSQSHGERKVLPDRSARWDPDERARGWHTHYDDDVANPSFLRDPVKLIEDRGVETRARYMPEMLAGAGLATRHLPSWALGGSLRRTIYFRSRPLTNSRLYRRLRPILLAPRDLVRIIRRPRGSVRATNR